MAAVAVSGAGLVLYGRGDGVTACDVVRCGLIVAWAGAGLWLCRRRALLGLGRLASGGAAVGAVAFAGAAGAALDWTGARGSVADVAHVFGTTLIVAVSLHLVLALPDGALADRGRRALAATGYGTCLVVAAIVMAGDRSVPGLVMWGLAVAAGAAGSWPAFRRYQFTAGPTRQRMQWLGCAATFCVEVALVTGALHLLVGWSGWAALVAGGATVVLPLALVAGSSHLVTRVDRLLVSTVSLAGLTAVVVGVYVLVVVGLGRTPSPSERGLVVLSMLAAAVAALLYPAARERLVDLSNRIVYGERRAPDETLRTFGSRLSRAVPMDELMLQLAESLRKSMGTLGASVWTGAGGTYERSVSVPDLGTDRLTIDPTELDVISRAGVSGTAWAAVWLPGLLDRRGHGDGQVRVAPVCHSGELLGLITVERPGDDDAFTEEEDQVLAELARQLGLALHNVQLDSALEASNEEVRRYAGELQESRARIVATADHERRKIERNLHDGAQQHLVALAVSLKLARESVGDDPESAVQMLDLLANSVKETIAELRDLAHGIYPPLLVDRGLPEALRAAAARSPLDVEVDVTGIERLASESEAAVYFCCLEALQNAGKHAPDASVVVRLVQDPDADHVTFEVTDDGPGFDVAEATAGHGYLNMSDRLGAIGGTVVWESTVGQGSRVAGTAPI